MLMSHAAISAGSTGLPRLGASANAALAVKSARETVEITMLRVDMLDRPRAVDRPAGDGVEVLVRKRRDRRGELQPCAFVVKIAKGRLHALRLVTRSASQDSGPAAAQAR